MRGLMLHCGSKGITRPELATLPVPAPMGPRHYIRPFIEEVEEISYLLNENGITITSEAYGVKSKVIDGGPGEVPAQFFGLMGLSIPGIYNDDYELTIGLRGSYDQTLSRGMVVGSSVFVCDNLCFSGEIECHTKQTLNINSRIGELLASSVRQVPDLANRQHGRFDRYKQVEVGQHGVDSAIIDLVRQGSINASQVGKVIAEWDVPSHEEHAQHGYSVWRFHNAVTEAIKPSDSNRANVLNTMTRTLPLTHMCDRLAA